MTYDLAQVEKAFLRSERAKQRLHDIIAQNIIGQKTISAFQQHKQFVRPKTSAPRHPRSGRRGSVHYF